LAGFHIVSIPTIMVNHGTMAGLHSYAGHAHWERSHMPPTERSPAEFTLARHLARAVKIWSHPLSWPW